MVEWHKDGPELSLKRVDAKGDRRVQGRFHSYGQGIEAFRLKRIDARGDHSTFSMHVALRVYLIRID